MEGNKLPEDILEESEYDELEKYFNDMIILADI